MEYELLASSINSDIDHVILEQLLLDLEASHGTPLDLDADISEILAYSSKKAKFGRKRFSSAKECSSPPMIGSPPGSPRKADSKRGRSHSGNKTLPHKISSPRSSAGNKITSPRSSSLEPRCALTVRKGASDEHSLPPKKHKSVAIHPVHSDPDLIPRKHTKSLETIKSSKIESSPTTSPLRRSHPENASSPKESSGHKLHKIATLEPVRDEEDGTDSALSRTMASGERMWKNFALSFKPTKHVDDHEEGEAKDTLLLKAIRQGSVAHVKTLILHGASIHPYALHALTASTVLYGTEKMKLLLLTGAVPYVNTADDHDMTPLHYLVQRLPANEDEISDLIEMLVYNGADADLQNGAEISVIFLFLSVAYRHCKHGNWLLSLLLRCCNPRQRFPNKMNILEMCQTGNDRKSKSERFLEASRIFAEAIDNYQPYRLPVHLLIEK